MRKLTKELRQHYRTDGAGGFVAKRVFTDEDEARAYAERQKQRAYQCTLCGNWHLGGKAKETRQERRAT